VNRQIRSLGQQLGRLPLGLWAILLTLPALIPLLRPGFFDSPDGLMHLYRLPALEQAVRSGVLYPRWFPEFAFGYGHPLFNFFGAATYYWGLPFIFLGADAAAAFQLTLATGLIASALGMLLFARQYFSRSAALVAVVVYLYLPYHLVDLYVRGAAAEFMAFVWFPFVLWAFGRTVEEPGKHGLAWGALAGLLLVALIGTHQLSAFVFLPVLLGYLVLAWLPCRDRRALGRVGLALGAAAILSAFYWLPVLAESRYVRLSIMRSQGYVEHLLSRAALFSVDLTYPYSGEPGVPSTYPIGLLQAIILVAAIAMLTALAYRRYRHAKRGLAAAPPVDPFDRQRRWVIVFFVAVAASSIYMLTRASLPVWQAFDSILAYLQFPWRIQVITVLATAFLAGAVWHVLWAMRPASRLLLGLLVIVLVWLLPWALWQLPIASVYPGLAVEDMWQMDRQIGQVGTTWDGEFIPTWVTEQRWAISLPVSSGGQPSSTAAQSPQAQVRLDAVGHTRYDLVLNAPQGAHLVMHQFHYPGWQARWNGRTVPSQPAGALGLAAFDLAPGSGELSLRLGLTPAQLWGTAISLAGFALGGIALVACARAQDHRSRVGPALLAAGYLLPAALLLGHLAWPNGYVRPVAQVGANLENTAELLGFAADRVSYRPGDTVRVTLYWRALRDLDQDYKVFVHLTDPAVTRQPAQHDGEPGGGFTPTSRWLSGELVPDTHPLALPADLAPGRYTLWAGLYEYPAMRNLAVVSTDGPVAGGRVYLGEIEVVAP
jgi:hypothetical protein